MATFTELRERFSDDGHKRGKQFEGDRQAIGHVVRCDLGRSVRGMPLRWGIPSWQL